MKRKLYFLFLLLIKPRRLFRLSWRARLARGRLARMNQVPLAKYISEMDLKPEHLESYRWFFTEPSPILKLLPKKESE